jgi:ABC-type branched-subunit amino acid transport system substrate-binding protein
LEQTEHSESEYCLVVTENYGQSGIQAFRELAEKANVCIAKEDSVLSNAEDEVFDRVIRKLDEDQNARVVVCFCEGMTVRGLLAATKRLNLTGRFLFLGRWVQGPVCIVLATVWSQMAVPREY